MEETHQGVVTTEETITVDFAGGKETFRLQFRSSKPIELYNDKSLPDDDTPRFSIRIFAQEWQE